MLGWYLVIHIPAFIGLIVGYYLRKKDPAVSKGLYILSGVYFVVGYGLCGRYMF